MKRATGLILWCTTFWSTVPVSSVLADFVVNQYDPYIQGQPAVATATDGSFVVVWRTRLVVENPPDPQRDGYALRARMFDADSRPLPAGEQQVYPIEGIDNWPAELDISDPTEPDVAISPDGTLVVVTWLHRYKSTGRREVYARRFSVTLESGGASVGELAPLDGSPLDVSDYSGNPTTEDANSTPVIATDPNLSGFMIAWEGEDKLIPNLEADIFGRIYDMTGTAVTTVEKVNTTTEWYQGSPSSTAQSRPFGRWERRSQ